MNERSPTVLGPHVDLPTCFIEIGSTENEWGIPELGLFWADLLCEHFREWDQNPLQQPQSQPPSPPQPQSSQQQPQPPPQAQSEIGISSSGLGLGQVVVMSIGGGHYVPKLNDAARLGEGLHIGHALASYTLQVGDRAGAGVGAGVGVGVGVGVGLHIGHALASYTLQVGVGRRG